MKHTITLNQGALRVLIDVLNQSGWAKLTSDIITAGKVLSTLTEPPLPDVKDKKEAELKSALLDWAAVEMPSFELEEKEREVCRKAIKHAVEAGQLPVRAHVAQLLLAFGFD